jgi:hypothetical protein
MISASKDPRLHSKASSRMRLTALCSSILSSSSKVGGGLSRKMLVALFSSTLDISETPSSAYKETSRIFLREVLPCDEAIVLMLGLFFFMMRKRQTDHSTSWFLLQATPNSELPSTRDGRIIIMHSVHCATCRIPFSDGCNIYYVYYISAWGYKGKLNIKYKFNVTSVERRLVRLALLI